MKKNRGIENTGGDIVAKGIRIENLLVLKKIKHVKSTVIAGYLIF